MSTACKSRKPPGPAYTVEDVERMRRLIWEQHVARVLYGDRSGNVTPIGRKENA